MYIYSYTYYVQKLNKGDIIYNQWHHQYLFKAAAFLKVTPRPHGV